MKKNYKFLRVIAIILFLTACDNLTIPVNNVISINEITGVTAPISGGIPVNRVTETDQFYGSVSWSPVSDSFIVNTTYTATITLNAKQGYTFDGINSDFFTIDGAISVSNSANSGVVIAEFPQTEYAPIDTVYDWDSGSSLYCSITTNENNKPFIASGWAIGSGTDDFNFSSYLSEQWSIESKLNGENIGYHTDIFSTDSTIYAAFGSDALRIYDNDSDSVKQVSSSVSLAMDFYIKDSIYYIVRYIPSSGNIELIFGNESSWNSVIIDKVGTDSSHYYYKLGLVVDEDDNCHIVYYNREDHVLKYAIYNGTYIVDSCSAAIDNNDNIHICFTVRSQSALFYTWR